MKIMKYFTKEWCWGDLDNTELDSISEKYDSYINSVYLQLPFSLKLLTKSIPLHDGIVKKIRLSSRGRDLNLMGTFGDLEVGYFNLEIGYKNVVEFDHTFASNTFNKKTIEIIRDEIEILNRISQPIFIHKFIFSNKTEFEIKFHECNIKISGTKAKNYRKKACSIVGF